MTSTASAQELRDQVNILVVDDLPEKHVVFRTILDELGQNIVSARSLSWATRVSSWSLASTAIRWDWASR